MTFVGPRFELKVGLGQTAYIIMIKANDDDCCNDKFQ